MATKVFVTKYALTEGIFELECEITADGYAKQVPTNRFGHFLGKRHYSLTKDDAVKQAEEMRIKKLNSLDKQIKKISALKFDI